MFFPVRPFQPSRMLESTWKVLHLSTLEKLAKDKHSSLLWTFVNYGPERFYNIGSWLQTTKMWFLVKQLNLHAVATAGCLARRTRARDDFLIPRNILTWWAGIAIVTSCPGQQGSQQHENLESDSFIKMIPVCVCNWQWQEHHLTVQQH